MAESQNSDFFEVTEEEDFDPNCMEDNCDILENSSSALSSKSLTGESVPVLSKTTLVMNDPLYFDHTDTIHKDLSTADTTQPKNSWVTYEDTHEIRQRKWSHVSSASSSSISVMSTTSSSTTYSS